MTDYKSTLNLPKTEFPMKANLVQREPETLARWDADDVYAAMLKARAGKAPFVLHDGPPYANGHIHIGHILNRVLKDITVKSRAMMGYHTPYVPGWDCHGLPIELAVEKELGGRAAVGDDTVKLRKACREYADRFVNIQRDEFRRLGCLAKWDEPYRTMDYAYQAQIARQFADFLEAGTVYNGKRPIYWCPSCQTALADAEVEYDSHSSPSIYVKFALQGMNEQRAEWGIGDAPLSAVIWTTTPWTIPANLGIAFHPEFTYAITKVGDEYWILAEELVDTVMQTVGIESYEIVSRTPGAVFDRCVARHPLLERDSLCMLGDHVTTEAGTGCVHTAPGHGEDDFHIGQRYQLPSLAPIDDGGKFTEEAGIADITGMFIKKANPVIMDLLRNAGALVFSNDIDHQYPHCWRCKRPILFRVTEQWFIGMEEGGLRKGALKAIDETEWIPGWGRNRIYNMIEDRPDWCISRQRRWGVPIVAARCTRCGERGSTPEWVRSIADRFAEVGADYWYETSIEELLPAGYACGNCGSSESFTKEEDILDVWFDSGSSWAAAMEPMIGYQAPADLYLEGSDQHRGWFHTSLLIALGTRGIAPYKAVFTHGFVVDGDGRKYSKSAKNYVPPEKIIKQYGAEILRLWVAAEDYRNDIRVSNDILKQLSDAYRKIRNTWRFLLGNVSDFNPQQHTVDYADLTELDRWVLHETDCLLEKCLASYERYEFHTLFHAVNTFCTVTLSARYLDICKDRLYCGVASGADRRSAQTALYRVLHVLTRLLAPVLSFTADEVWRHMPDAEQLTGTVFEHDFPARESQWNDQVLAARWATIWSAREVATKAMELARENKVIGNAIDAQLTIECDADLRATLKSVGVPVADIFLVSDVQFAAASGDYVVSSEDNSLRIAVHAIDTEKCARCWKRQDKAEGRDVCVRCSGVVEQLSVAS